MRKHKTIAQRFEPKVRQGDGCWTWIGTRHYTGYGCIKVLGEDGIWRQERAHRVAWTMASGKPIPDGMVIGHTCDAGPEGCVRNDDQGTYIVAGEAYPRFGHLWMGTAIANRQDCVDKARHATGLTHGSVTRQAMRPRGEGHGSSKLTEESVLEIRRKYAGGARQVDIAAEHGISQITVSNVVLRKTWEHVTPPSPAEASP